MDKPGSFTRGGQVRWPRGGVSPRRLVVDGEGGMPMSANKNVASLGTLGQPKTMSARPVRCKERQIRSAKFTGRTREACLEGVAVFGSVTRVSGRG